MVVDAANAIKHPDGTLCLEGTTSLPPDFQPCCDVFAAHTSTCVYDLRYEWWPRSRQWVIAIAEAAGGGGIVIHYCPIAAPGWWIRHLDLGTLALKESSLAGGGFCRAGFTTGVSEGINPMTMPGNSRQRLA